MGHALSQGKITPSRYAGGRHICVSRRGLDKGPIDEALKPFGLEREIVTIVGGFSTALALARGTDLGGKAERVKSGVEQSAGRYGRSAVYPKAKTNYLTPDLTP